jgi:hypothetical protein
MRKFWKDCGCEGDPACRSCYGTGRVRDYDAEAECADRMHDQAKDDRLDRDPYPPLFGSDE